MHKIISLLIIAGCVLLPLGVFASKEGVLVWSEFKILSPGIGSSGPAKVSGKQNSAGIISIKIEAFSQKFIAPASTVQELQGFSANGLLLSYENGYKELGGRTLYLSFFRGFTSGIVSTKTVSVNENGEFKIINDSSK